MSISLMSFGITSKNCEVRKKKELGELSLLVLRFRSSYLCLLRKEAEEERLQRHHHEEESFRRE